MTLVKKLVILNKKLNKIEYKKFGLVKNTLLRIQNDIELYEYVLSTDNLDIDICETRRIVNFMLDDSKKENSQFTKADLNKEKKLLKLFLQRKREETLSI